MTSRVIKVYRCPSCKHTFLNRSLEYIANHKANCNVEIKVFDSKPKSFKAKKKQSKATKKLINLRNKNTYLRKKINEISRKSSLKRQNREPHPFYDSQPWRKLRFKALELYTHKCMCCGAENTIIHVDHIKPRSKYPHLELDFDNLQILCESCNLGKMADSEHDFRSPKGIV